MASRYEKCIYIYNSKGLRLYGAIKTHVAGIIQRVKNDKNHVFMSIMFYKIKYLHCPEFLRLHFIYTSVQAFKTSAVFITISS